MENNETRDSRRYLAFTLGKDQFAIPLLQVKEVIALGETTPIPNSPEYFKGVMNLRGKVYSVIDLRKKFNLSNIQDTRSTVVIILDLSPLRLGVIVDSVDNVVTVDAANINPPPDVESSIGQGALTGIFQNKEKLVLLLDLEKTLSVEDLKAMHRRNAETSATKRAA